MLTANADITDRLYQTVSDTLAVDRAILSEAASPETIESWDSLNHLNLIMALEDAFQTSFSPEDTLQMHTIGAIRAILGRSPGDSPDRASFVDCQDDLLPALKAFVARSYGADYVLAVNDAYVRWQYATPPVNNGSGMNIKLALVEGEVVGCLGYIPMEVNLGSNTLNGAWLANWMVDPDKRALGLGPLLVREVSQAFDVTLALGANRDARDILTRMGWTDLGALNRYVRILDLQQAALLTDGESLQWPVPRIAAKPTGKRVRKVKRFDQRIVSVWDRVWGNQERAAGTRRSADFLNWRYADHPQFPYRLFESDSGSDGFAVYRVEQARGLPVRVGHIVELVAEPDAASYLLSAMIGDAQRLGVAALDFFCASDQMADLFGRHGFLPGTHPAAAEIPLLYQPVDRRKQEIPFLADLQNIPNASRVEHWYATKSDGDQDRPN